MLGNASYPTYQAFLALGIAALITIALMPLWIKILKYESIGQQVRADGPKRHLVKQGTPTMGGVVILIAIVLTCLIMAKHTTEMLLVLIATVATGVLGLIDDLTSVTHGRSLGLTPHAKMIGLTLICVVFCLGAVNFCGVPAEVRFPGGFAIDLSVLSTTIDLAGTSFTIPWLFLIFTWLLIAGFSIPENSDNKDLTMEFIEQLNTYDAYKTYIMQAGNTSVRTDIAEDEDYASQPFMTQAAEFLDVAAFRPQNDQYSTVSTSIQQMVEAVASGDTPENAMKQYATSVANAVGEENTTKQ